jgi:RNA polymerase sigma factor (sigma-70 family)
MMSQRPESLRRLWQWMRPEADEVLLERYLVAADEAAFNTLVKRYAGLVYSVCRRILPLAADAEDACQVTFLILAQRAGRIQKKSALRCWLHGVAIRVAKAARRRQMRFRQREQFAAETAIVASPAELLADDDVQELLRHEVERLPERYRVPLQLCYWQGQSREEMAATLGWTTGMVKGQLERAKKRLKARLARRGVQLQLPIGLGLAALGAVTLLPAVVSAATTASSVPTFLMSGMRFMPVLARGFEIGCKMLQAGKGVATIAVVSATLGLTPAFLSSPPEEEPRAVGAEWVVEEDADPIAARCLGR